MGIEEVFQEYEQWTRGKRTNEEMIKLFEDLEKQHSGTFFYHWWYRVRMAIKQ